MGIGVVILGITVSASLAASTSVLVPSTGTSAPTRPTPSSSPPTPPAVTSPPPTATTGCTGFGCGSSSADVSKAIEAQKRQQALLQAQQEADRRAAAQPISPGGAIAPSDAAPPSVDDAAKDLLRALGSVSRTAPPPSPQTAAIYEQIKRFHAAQAKRESDMMPLLFLDEVDTDGLMTQAMASTGLLKGTMTVAVDSTYTWGVEDLKAINKALGYPPQQVPQNCQIRLTIKATGGSPMAASAKILAGQKGTLYVSDAPQGLTFTSSAVCKPPVGGVPHSGVIIYRSGTKYVVQLPIPGACDAPSNRASLTTAALRFNGDGAVTCAFR